MKKNPFELLQRKRKREDDKEGLKKGWYSESDEENEESDRSAYFDDYDIDSESEESNIDFSFDDYDTDEPAYFNKDPYSDDDSENPSESDLDVNDIIELIREGFDPEQDIRYIIDSPDTEEAINTVLGSQCSTGEIDSIYQMFNAENALITDTDLIVSQLEHFVDKKSDTISDVETVKQLIEMARTSDRLSPDLFREVLKFDNSHFLKLIGADYFDKRHLEQILDDTTLLAEAIWTEESNSDFKEHLKDIIIERDSIELLEKWFETNSDSSDENSSDSEDLDEYTSAIQQLLLNAVQKKAINCVIYLCEKKRAKIDEIVKEAAVLSDDIEILKYLNVRYKKRRVLMTVRNIKLNSLEYFAQLEPKLAYQQVISTLPIESKKIKRGTADLYVVLWNSLKGEVFVTDRMIFLNNILTKAPKTLTGHFIAEVGVDELICFFKKRRKNGEKLKAKFDQFLKESFTQKHLEKSSKTEANSRALSQQLCPFPERAELNAAPVLMGLRSLMALDRRLSIEDRWVACLLGVQLSSMRHLFPQVMRTPHFVMPVERMETYPRAADSVTAVELSGSISLPPKTGSAEEKAKKPKQTWIANTGQYKTPMEALADKGRKTQGGILKLPLEPNNLRLKTTLNSDDPDAVIYTASLVYRQKISQHIVDNYKSEKGIVKVIYANGYPHLMVYITPPNEAKQKSEAVSYSWTQNLIHLFGPIVNQLFMNEGYHIETGARASFGFLTPTYAPCDNSIRINIGLIPKACADLIVSALEILDQMLFQLYHKTQYSQWPIKETSVFKGDNYEKYLKKEIPNLTTVYQALWTKVETGKRGLTLAQTMMRTGQLRLWITAEVSRQLQIKTPNSAEELVKLWMRILSQATHKQFKLKNGTLSAKKPDIDLPEVPDIPKQQREDPDLYRLVNQIIQAVKTKLPRIDHLPPLLEKSMDNTLDALDKCQKEGTTQDLYYQLDMLNELLFSWSIYYSNALKLTDGEASDSDDEGPIVDHEGSTLYGKKYVTHNGIRSIWAGIEMAANYLRKKEKKTSPVFSFINPYYELRNTIEDWAKHAKITFSKQPCLTSDILFLDINGCETKEIINPPITLSQIGTPKILILDITSAVPDFVRTWLSILLEQKKTLSAIILVSSGLKECQLGADKNHHGIVRVFSLNKRMRDEMMDILKQTEHPVLNRISHAHRRLMKKLGFASTSRSFFKSQSGDSSFIQSMPPTLFSTHQANRRKKENEQPSPLSNTHKVQRSLNLDPNLKIATGAGNSLKKFKVADPRGAGSNGNCGFTVLGVTREKLVEKLLEHGHKIAVRKSLSEAIKSHYMIQQDEAKTFPNLYHALLHHQSDPSEATESALNDACTEINVYKKYVNSFLTAGVWLDYRSALAYARLSHIDLYIWEQPQSQTNEIRVRESHSCAHPKGIINILYTNNATHFQLLYQTIEDDDVLVNVTKTMR
jgi:hypothetical protein